MKNFLLILLSILLVIPPCFAKPVKHSKKLDYRLKLGQHEILTPYHSAGDIALVDGYLITVPDLALLEMEIATFETTMKSNLNLLSEQCQKELSQCQEDADQRFINLIKDNEHLTEKLSLYKDLYESQETRTIIYTVSAVLVTGLTSFLIVKAVY